MMEDNQDHFEILRKIEKNPESSQRELADEFGSQCVVVGIDSKNIDGKYIVFSHTGDEKTVKNTDLETKKWIDTIQELGAGEIVLNCMNQDGVRNGYDINQLNLMLSDCDVPLIASGGAGSEMDFNEVLTKTSSSGALAASVFHKNLININKLKESLKNKSINVRC